MKLLELIYQRGDSKDFKKFVFGKSYNALEVSKSEISPDVFREILNSSFNPSYIPSGGLKASRDPDEKVRLGITFNFENTTYRFVRDLAHNVYSLSKFNERKKQFDEVSRKRSFIKKAFKDTFKMPESSIYDKLCIFDSASIRSEVSRWKKKTQGHVISYFETLEKDEVMMQKIKRLKALEDEKAGLENIANYEFELDGFQAKLFEINETLNKIKEKEENLKALSVELKEYDSLKCLEEFPEDIAKRLTVYEKTEESKKTELISLDQKLDTLVNGLAALKIEPIQKDKTLILSSILGIASFALAMFLPKYLILLLVLFFIFLGSAAWRLILFFKKKEDEEKFNREIKSVKEDRAVIDKKFDIETKVVREFLSRVGVSHSEEALDLIKRRESLENNFSKEKKAFEEYKTKHNFDEVVLEKEKIEKEIEIREEKLRSVPPASMDPNDINTEIDSLKSEIGEENLERIADFDGTATPSKDAFSFIINQTAKLLKISKDKIIQSLKSSFPVNLAILSDKYFHEVSWTSEGIDTITSYDKSEPSTVETLSDDENLVVFFALQFTLVQLLANHNRLPIVVFGVFETEKPALKKDNFLKAVNHLSKSCQVLHIL